MNTTKKILFLFLYCFFISFKAFASNHPADPFVIINSKIPFITDHEYFYTKDTTNIYVIFLAYKSDILSIDNAKTFEKFFLKIMTSFKNILMIRSYGANIKAPGSESDPSATNFDYSQFPVIFIIHNNAIIATLKGYNTYNALITFVINTIQNNP